VFSDCSAHETLEKYISKKCKLTKNSRQCKLWKIVSNLAALFSFLQRMPLETHTSIPHSLTLIPVMALLWIRSIRRALVGQSTFGNRRFGSCHSRNISQEAIGNFWG